MTRQVIEAPPASAAPAGVAGPGPVRRGLPPALPALLSGVLMLAIALTHAGRPRLSWDEVTTADVARRSFGQIWQLAQNVDGVFAPYYTLMRCWSALVGDSELLLRLPSILAMAGAVGLAAELGRRLFTAPVGLVAGLILALLPNTSRYAAEARPYAFACLFAVLALLLLLRALRRGGRLAWAAYGLAVLLLGAAHLVALTTLAAHALFVAQQAARERKTSRPAGRLPRAVRAWLAALAVALAPLAPLAYLGMHQQSTQLHWVSPLTVRGIGVMPGQIVGSAPAAWLLIGLALLAVFGNGAPGRVRPLAVYALAPAACLAAVSLTAPMWVARYLLVVLAPVAVLAAVALVGAHPRPRRRNLARTLVALLLLAGAVVPGQVQIRSRTAKNGADYRGVAQLIGERQQPGEVIVYQPRSRSLRAGMDYYLRQLPNAPRDVLLRRSAAAAGRLAADEHPADAAHVGAAPGIWVVVGDERPDPLTALRGLRPLFNGGYERVGLWRLKSATVALYRRR